MLPGRRGWEAPKGELAELLWPERGAQRPRGPALCLVQTQEDTGEESAHDGEEEEEAHFFLIDGDLLGVEPTEVELDLRPLEAAVSLAREKPRRQPAAPL